MFSAAGFLRVGFDLVAVAAMFLGCVHVTADADPLLDLKRTKAAYACGEGCVILAQEQEQEYQKAPAEVFGVTEPEACRHTATNESRPHRCAWRASSKGNDELYWYSDNVRSYISILLVKIATHTLNVTLNYWLVSLYCVKVGQDICL